MADAESVTRDLLLDAFGRIHEMVPNAVQGLSADQLAHRPSGTGNSIAWLVWHLARVEDETVADFAGRTSVWIEDDWHGRSGLPFEPGAHGYGHTSEEVDQVGVLTAEFLVGYHEAVHARTDEYYRGIDADELARVVDTNWDPPVTVAIRTVSIIGDALQHLGQVGYIRGLQGADGDLEDFGDD